jgi:hypothetical protein
LGSYYDQQIKARITRRKNKENTDNEQLIDIKNAESPADAEA